MISIEEMVGVARDVHYMVAIRRRIEHFKKTQYSSKLWKDPNLSAEYRDMLRDHLAPLTDAQITLITDH
jgi:hypothetical protein